MNNDRLHRFVVRLNCGMDVGLDLKILRDRARYDQKPKVAWDPETGEMVVRFRLKCDIHEPLPEE